VISDFVCFILYHIVGYRKKVVFANLKQAFLENRKKIEKELPGNSTGTLRIILLNSLNSFLHHLLVSETFQGDYSIPLRLSTGKTLPGIVSSQL
jgi:hypothetical protein